LFDLLSKHFGSEQVFMDIDTIGPGENYVEVIEKTCESCEVLLAVIGRNWVNAVDQGGNRRLDDPGDFVRLEITHVLEKGSRVVPVLVDGARMPDAKDLPENLKKLALRNAWEINDKSFHHDVDMLIEALKKMQPTLQPAPPSATAIEHARLRAIRAAKGGASREGVEQAGVPRKTIYAGIGGAAVLALALIAYFGWFRATPELNTQTGPTTKQKPATTTATKQTGVSGSYDIPSLQANVGAPLLFFEFAPNAPMPGPGQRPYATSFRAALSAGKRMFWEIGMNFQGQFPPQDYQIESVWYCNSQEVFRGTGNYRGSDVSVRAFHNRFAWDPPGGRLPVGQYRVDLFIAGRRITSGNFVVEP
jgi:hypothetical protein